MRGMVGGILLIPALRQQWQMDLYVAILVYRASSWPSRAI